MQLQICCVLLLTVSVLAQYRHQWPNSYGPSRSPYIVSHRIPLIEEFKRRWMGFYDYRPIFSRVLFGSIPDSVEMWTPASEKIYKGQGRPVHFPIYTPPSMVPDVGESEGFQNWKQELFGPPKQIELHQRFPSEDSDSQELEEIVPDNVNIGAHQDDDSTHIKDDFNTTSVVNVDNEDKGIIDSEEKEEHNHSMEEKEQENPDKNVELDDDGKSEYPATSPELVELNPEKTSGEVSEDVAEPEVFKGPSDPSEPADIHWNPWKSAFDYPSNEKRPTDFFQSNNGHQSSEVPDRVKIATQDPFSKWWNSAEEFSFFSDDDTPAGLSESSEAVADPKPTISPAVPSTTPEPIYKFDGQSISTDGPKTVYKHNYRKVTIDKNNRLQAQITA